MIYYVTMALQFYDYGIKFIFTSYHNALNEVIAPMLEETGMGKEKKIIK